MRLERIKLVGFKSFVDATSVDFPSQIMGVVGPNGCGKSNIIDAVRWVMGESSAKNLRGQSLTDVIFNGTIERKPVGQASIELVFDNREGKLGGEYAQYNQISIKRQVNRDSQSTYFLNGTRCRRRDIVDVFLGTGLSPRSYSIIEQGMISRLIESKPEEFRVHLEEVSGISKYKDRRRETENRIRHTKENLDRLNDLREEVDKQLEKLERQANAAERYKVLKAEERTLKGQDLALRWQELDQQAQSIQKERSDEETALQSLLAEQQRIETQTTQERERQHELLESYNEVQTRYYDVGAEISRVEQSIKHHRERQQQLHEDLAQAEQAWQSMNEHYQQDQQTLTELNASQEALLPEVEVIKEQAEEAQQQFSEAEEQARLWQAEWDEFNNKAAKSSQTAQVEQTRIQHIEKDQLEAQKRLTAIKEEREQLSVTEKHSELADLHETLMVNSEEVAEQEQNLTQVLNERERKQEQQRILSERLNELRSELQTVKGQLASLEALQQEALGKKDETVSEWLVEQGLDQATRLAELLKVETGWERAVEQVLGAYLDAVCLDDMAQLKTQLNSLENSALTFINPETKIQAKQTQSYLSLGDKVTGAAAVKDLLSFVYVADTLEQAVAMAQNLLAHESVICPAGIWLGKSWIQVAKGQSIKSGVLAREQELKTCYSQVQSLEADIQYTSQELEQCEEALDSYETERETLQTKLNDSRSNVSDVKAKISVAQSQVEQIQTRLNRLEDEEIELQKQLSQANDELDSARASWQKAMTAMEIDANAREALLSKRDQNRERLEEARQQVRETNNHLHDLEIQSRTNQSRVTSLEESLARMSEQSDSLRERCEQLRASLEEGGTPVEEMEAQLKQALERRVKVEDELNAAKQGLNTCEHEMRELEQQRHQSDETIQSKRQKLEASRMHERELSVRCDTLLEQLKELEFELESVLADIPKDKDKTAINEELTRTGHRIQRLGAINLAAIDEYQVQRERKEYLDSQHADVEEALTTLEDAIHKIDKETRSRFKEAFDTVNQHFQEYFPKVFGGGSARLELTDDDLLIAGVQVIARPPGKKNSTIHLLSGGEKALTAISLVFSLFQLNPAPFCMLDEVDAPLDDANVARFCNLVREISKKVQIIFISHNKVAIEMAQHLIGVTMHEPGVSRIVSVDVEEAVAMAEEA